MLTPEEIAQIQKRQRQVMPEWRPWLSSLDASQIAVLKKYDILDQKGKPTVTSYKPHKRHNGEIYPPFDVKMGLATAKRLMALDPTEDHVWTDWIFFQAGGGQAAVAQIAVSRRNVKTGVYNELRTDFIETARREGRKVTPEEAEQYADQIWEEHEKYVNQLTQNADEDVIIDLMGSSTQSDRMNFGYFRDYPGFSGLYKKLDDACTAYFSVYNKAVEMNNELRDGRNEPGAEGFEPVPLTPDEMDGIQTMLLAVRNVKVYFQSRMARKDVRVARWQDKTTIWDDDVLTLIVPLTYAAAVRYGNDRWPWANRQSFSSEIKLGKSSEWQRILRGGSVVGYVTFNVPVTANLNQAGRRERLNQLALVANKNGDLHVYDDRGKTMTLDQVTAVFDAAAQPVDPDSQPSSVHPNHPVKPPTRHRQPEEVEAIKASFDQAVDAFYQFVQQFDPSEIVADISDVDINQSVAA